MKPKACNQNFQSRRKFIKYGSMIITGAVISPYGFINGCNILKNKKPNIILVTLDTTRFDHLSCYGYQRKTTPNIDRIAENSVLYHNAISPSSWTLPSHASLFTGKFPSSHCAMYSSDGPVHLGDGIGLSSNGQNMLQKFRARNLSDNEYTLAEILKKNGYNTGAIVSGPWMKKIFGLAQGFDFYDDSDISNLNGKLAKQVTKNALEWLEKSDKRPFFLFLNYFDPHIPYMAPEGYMNRFLSQDTDFRGRQPTDSELIDLYDGEILYMDHYFGILMDRLKMMQKYDNCMIIITADHGELFGEHGKYRHGKTLYQEEIHVPLIIKWPGNEISSQTSDQIIQLNDLFAVILNRLNIPVPSDTQSETPPQTKHPILSETYPLESISTEGHYRALFKKDYKFIWNSKGNHELYNLKDDSKENHNLINSDNYPKRQLITEINDYINALPRSRKTSTSISIDSDTKNALQSLGYLK